LIYDPLRHDAPDEFRKLFVRVQPGMSEPEVSALLSQPTHSAPGAWIYVRPEDPKNPAARWKFIIRWQDKRVASAETEANG
jgi:hypothetical protein